MADAQTVSVSFYLPVQIALLVLFYGNIMPTLPMWLVWLPTLLLLGVIVIAVVLIIAFFSNR
jgi:hypothetical protein